MMQSNAAIFFSSSCPLNAQVVHCPPSSSAPGPSVGASSSDQSAAKSGAPKSTVLRGENQQSVLPAAIKVVPPYFNKEEINLSEREAFTQRKFKSLANDSFIKGYDYFIVLIKEKNDQGDFVHLHDGISMARNVLEYGRAANPSTQKEITQAAIYALSNLADSFRYICDLKELQSEENGKYLQDLLLAQDPATPAEMQMWNQGKLALAYEKGQGLLKRDYQKAYYWYRQAGEKGLYFGWLRAGMYHALGFLGKKSKKAALRCYLEAAKLCGSDVEKQKQIHNLIAHTYIGSSHLSYADRLNKALEHYKSAAELGSRKAKKRVLALESKASQRIAGSRP